MNYWLIKSEPDVYSWDKLNEEKIGTWDGVRNYQARNNLKAMQKGDKLLFYHSNIGKEIVGIAEVHKEFFQDPNTENPNWVAIEVIPIVKLKKSVSLLEIKNEGSLFQMVLLKNSRLSVQPVKAEEFDKVVEMSER